MRNQSRCFVAIELSHQVRSRISRYLRDHVTDLERVKWVSPDQFHLTLKFLGDVPQTDLHHVIGAVKKACAQTDPFDLVFDRLSAFPNTEHPHTLWIGVSEGIEEVAVLAEAINEELYKIGFPREVRRFTPHLTIGRVRKLFADELSGIGSFIIPSKTPPVFGISAVDSVTLFSSEPDRNGSRYYESLSEIRLRSVG